MFYSSRNYFKKYFHYLIIIFVLGNSYIVHNCFAQSESLIQVSPYVIDEKAKASDIFKYEIKVKNTSSIRYDLYPVVTDVDVASGSLVSIPPSELDKSVSVTRWIKFSRGVLELSPGDEKVIPLEISVNMNAKPGKYYGAIVFSPGSNRYEAEEKINTGSLSRLTINIEVQEDVVEKMNIVNYKAVKNTFINPPVILETELKNSGTNSQVPTGAVYIQNRKGIEVKKIIFNEENASIAAGETKTFQIKWDDPGDIGKFKARIELEYGEKTKKDLNDTAYFWIFPWKIVILFSVLIAILIIALTILIFYRTRNVFHHEPSVNDPVINLRHHK